MSRATLRQRARYWFDNTMARGTPALIGWLAMTSFALVATISVLLVAFAQKDKTSFALVLTETWKNIVTTFKLGGATAGSLPHRSLVVLLALAGILFASTLVSLLTAGVNRKLAELRKGRSMVIERDHTVLIGWSDQVFTIVSELIEANASRRRSCIAILADKDRTTMEDEIRKAIRKTGSTRVVCRTGNPMDPADLDLVNPQHARSIIVLTPPGEAPDAQTTKTLLAIVNSPTRRKEPYHVVAAVRHARNRAVASVAGGDEAMVVDGDDIAARLIVQTCRQSGLSVVYTGLLDFAGDEIYMTAAPGLAGRTFGEALPAYRTSAVIGLRRADGTVVLNPPMATVITADDEIIAISEDDDTLVMSEDVPRIAADAIVSPPAHAPVPERSLLLGWNRRAATIVEQLNAYVAPGSTLDVIADTSDAKGELDELKPALANLEVSFSLGDTDERGVLELVDVGSYDHVVVLCYDALDPHHADSRALVTLLHLRAMQAESNQRYSIVSEMSDDRNRQLVQVTRADDFIVSEKLISLLMAQLSENRHLVDVFADLFDSDGPEIYLSPAEDYVRLGHDIDFYTVVEAARRRGHSAIGYRVHDHVGDAPSFGVVLNPDKSRPLAFAPGDRVIVLAQDAVPA